MLGQIVQIFLAIPDVMRAIKALIAFWKELQYKQEVSTHAQVAKEVENAQTSEQKQNALNNALGSISK